MQEKIAIIGLGYVGLPLAHAFSKKYDVVGIDINNSRIEELNNGFDRTLELNEAQVKECLDNGMLFSTNIQDVKDCNIFIVTVPTPITNKNQPDLTPLIKSSEAVGTVLKKGDIVIYESTVYPGVTEEVCVPILEKVSGLKYISSNALSTINYQPSTETEGFYCGYSPERINPGDKEHTVTKILKITAGSTPEIAKRVDDLYKSIIEAGTHLAPSIKVAEAAKVIENTQRDVNIALMNELSMIFDTMGIDTKAVLEAAGTKWNFIKLSPGLVGGHCIGVDPYYLTYKAQEMGYTPNLILGARQINNSVSKLIADKTIKFMLKENKQINGAKILVMGVTFKENCPDMRNTKVVDIIKELEEFRCSVDVYDYWVDKSDKESKGLNFIDELPLNSNSYDAIIVAVAHDKFKELKDDDFKSMSNGEPIVIDVKGITPNPTWKLN